MGLGVSRFGVFGVGLLSGDFLMSFGVGVGHFLVSDGMVSGLVCMSGMVSSLVSMSMSGVFGVSVCMSVGSMTLVGVGFFSNYLGGIDGSGEDY